jgi:tyrosine-protein kinase Etk/Wzc
LLLQPQFIAFIADDMTPDTEQRPSTNIMRRDSMMNEHIERHAPEMVKDAGAGELKTYFNVLFDNLWLILAVAFAVGVAGVLYAMGTKSVYESNMTILVEETSPNATKNILSEASSLFETRKATVSEMELLRSRQVLAPVVDTLRLYIDVQPKYFPLIGAAIANARGGELSQPGLFGYGGYAWGAEKMDVSTFNVSGAMQNSTFVVTARGNNTYRLSDDKRRIAWDGKVGIPMRAKLSDGELEVRIDRLDARPGAQFTLRRLSKQTLIAGIQGSLRIAEQGKQSGVVEVKLQGEDPARVHAILDETAREYLRQTLSRKREDAEKSLAFLDTQLLPLRAQLDQSEAEYSQFRHRHGTVNLADEARVGVEQSAAAKARRAELQQRKAELLTKYGDRHPAVVGIDSQLRDMDLAARKDGELIRALPALEQDEQKMTRDIKVKSELYTTLSNTAQQLRILAASKSSNVRLVDAPTFPEAPIKPNRSLIISAAVMMGLFLGMVAAFVKRAVSAGIDGPKAIEKMLGARVVQVSIPHSSYQQQLIKQASRGSRKIPMLARVAPEDPAIEALRSFRAALQFSMPYFRNNIVMITGPTSRLGKSFISANGATVIAASGKRVLLIDADLREGHLHRYFGNEQTPGLYEAVTGAMPVEKIIWREVMKNLDFIPTGAWPPNPSEFLTNANFGALLESVSKNYDLVMIDAPRVLGVADALIIGAHAGAVFLLARAGTTTEDEINESIKRLNQAGIVPEGILFNDLRVRRGTPEYQYKPRETQQIDCAG